MDAAGPGQLFENRSFSSFPSGKDKTLLLSNSIQMWQVGICLYSWSLQNVAFNSVGPLLCGYFSVVNTVVSLGLWLAESSDVEELWMWRADYKLYVD